MLGETGPDVVADELGLAVDDVLVEEDEDVRRERNESGWFAFLRNDQRDAAVTAVALARLHLIRGVASDVFGCISVTLRREESLREPLAENRLAVVIIIVVIVDVVVVVVVVFVHVGAGEVVLGNAAVGGA